LPHHGASRLQGVRVRAAASATQNAPLVTTSPPAGA
jgi:hypothetical protein